jgi:hypothetical protein
MSWNGGVREFAAATRWRSCNKAKEAIKQGATIGGGMAGTALAGLVVFSVCGPAAPICTIGFLLAAGTASGWAASTAVDYFDDELEEFTKWKIN